MQKIQRFACLLLALLLIRASVVAQSAATADLHGTVQDSSGAVMQSATVSVRDESRNFERTVQPNEAGYFTFLSLPPGHYTVTVTAKSFSPTAAKDVAVSVGQVADYPGTMQVAEDAEITVRGEPLLIETSKTSTSTTIGQERIENLPTNGRNYINFSLTNSQVQRDAAPSLGGAPTSGLNFGGQRARSNAVNVDAMDAVDNSVNGIRSTLSQEGVQEFQIITNGYEAEYGRATGGVGNNITKSRTHNFSRSAFRLPHQPNLSAPKPTS